MTFDPTPLELAAVWAVAAFLYNNHPAALAEALFPNRHPSYRDEWIKRFEQGLGGAVGKMDNDTFKRFVAKALEHYGKPAYERFADVLETGK